MDEPTDWVNALVIAENLNGSLMLCLYRKDLNNHIKKEHYHLPDKSEIAADMSRAEFLFKLDASQGCYQMH